jgi:hypothetical protein
MRLAAALVVTGLIGASATLYTPKAEAGVYVGIGIPAPVVVAPRVVVHAYYGPRVVVGYPRVGYPAPYGWGYGGWRYGYHGYAHAGLAYGGRYHYHR